MAYQPTDNSPNLFPSHDEAHQDLHHGHMEVEAPREPPREPPREAPEIAEQRPDSQDVFISMVAETFRDLTREQRSYAQREIIKVLNQARYVGADNSQSSRDTGFPGHSSNMGAFDRTQGLQYDNPAGFLQGFGVTYSPQRGNRSMNAGVRAAAEESSDLEWGFTPENSLSP